MSLDKEVFIGRQPILDPHQRISAYELLFRHSADARSAVISDYVSAASQVIVNTFASIGADTVLGRHLGFINLTREMLVSDVVEALPKEKVVLEILESVEADDEVVKRCRELKGRGFKLALDDYIYRDPREPLVELVDYVKVDLLAVEEKSLPWLVRKLQRAKVKTLAEKVEDTEAFETCKKLGFDLYQGFYFARPTIVSGKVLDPGRLAVLKLLQQLGQDVDIEEIADTFKHNVDLGVNLLRLVNSAAMARRHKIARVRDAVAFLGRRQLRRWLTLLLFAGADAAGSASPLLQTAALRGRLMEQLMRARFGEESRNRELEDRAFLAGMLSLLDALLHVPKDVLVNELNLDDEIRDALLEGKGDLGDMLVLVEKLERFEFEGLLSLLERLDISQDVLQDAQFQAFSWVQGLTEPGAREDD